jgi:cell division transport system permease protein
MIGARFGWARFDLPLGRDEAARFLPWIIALMVYLAALGGIALIVLDGTLGAAQRSLAATWTLQVPADISNARLETVLATLRQTKGIRSAQVLAPAQTARLLEPWLGSTVPLDELPVPRLIDLRIDPAAAPDLAPLRQQLASVVPEARLEDPRPWLAGVRAGAHRIESILGAAIAGALLLVALSAVFAVRSALLVHRSAVELLHLLGAGDADIAGQFAIRSLALGLLGGAIGAIAALLTVVALAGAGGVVQLPAPPGMTGAATGIADWRIWAVLVGGILAAGLIAMASAQVTVLRWLARMM